MDRVTFNIRNNKFAKKQLNNEENNPCLKEQKMSLKCLEKNNYESENCKMYFENYKNCRKFWSAVQKHRRINGIDPSLPLPEEREEIKRKYKTTGKM